MNIRHKFKITLEEENKLVKELINSFQTIYNQNAEKKFSDVLTKMLALDFDSVRDGDIVTISYEQEFNMGAIQMMINNMRSVKKPRKPKPERR
jgi:hypothetical protein